MNLLDDRRLEGTIPEIIEEARVTIPELLPNVTRLGPDGRFAPVPLYPEFAWLEAVVNALAHRSYSIGGDHVRMAIFDDRVEIESPGRLPGLVRIDNIRQTRFSRNPRITRVLAEMGYVRELGEGVNRMFDEMREAGLPSPIYAQTSASVRVILPSDPLFGMISDLVGNKAEPLIRQLRDFGRLSTAQAMNLLQVSRPTVLRLLRRLVEANILEHVGSARDPRGFWRLRSSSKIDTNKNGADH